MNNLIRLLYITLPLAVAYEKIASYEPTSFVADYANIAIDLRTIEAQLATRSQEGKDNAFRVYREGAYTKSYANITLNFPLTIDRIDKGTKVVGINNNEDIVDGIVMEDAVKGDSSISIQYFFPPSRKIHLNCYVGGIPQAVTEGCFKDNGQITIILSLGQKLLDYTYNVLEDTHNDITLQKFSTNAEKDMVDSDGRFFTMLRRFNKYYGTPNYADQWVTAAFSNEDTNFLNGNAQFKDYGSDGSAVAVVDGISVLNIWMYVIRQMEYSLDKCALLCVGCDDESLHAWDTAVALYTGSIIDSPSENGMLLYTLAGTMCRYFGTCKNDINGKIFELFNRGRDFLLNDMDCIPLKEVVEKITNLMTIPLVQGMLDAAYTKDKFKDSREKVEAKGAVFAAAVLPIVDYCNHNWAELIYKNMRLGYDGTGSFEVVKDAIERQYECLGISCEDVGGIVNMIDGTYHENAEPCGLPESSAKSVSTPSTPKSEPSDPNSSSGSLNVGAIVGITLGLIAVAVFSALFMYRRIRNGKEVPTDLQMDTSIEVQTPDII